MLTDRSAEGVAMVPKIIKRRVRPLWVAGLLSAGWANRADVKRWIGFGRRAWTDRKSRPLSDLMTEARARAAISVDPVLRRDKSLQDVSVHDGVATLVTTTHPWPDGQAHLAKVRQVRGISEVVTVNAPVGAARL
jgi:hypothetical protein